MRRLMLLPVVLLPVVLLSALVVRVPKASAEPAPPPGAIRLLEGYHHERLQGIDSTVGRIWKDGGLEIRYDIGGLAGNYAALTKASERSWAMTQVINGQSAEIVRTKDGRVIVSFEGNVNFFAKISNDEDLAALLTIALTYPAAPERPSK